MGGPRTLLEGLCGHTLSFGGQSIEVEYKDEREWVFAHKDGARIRIANYKSDSADGKELRGDLYAAAKKPVRTVLGGKVCILKVRVFQILGEDCFEVSIDPAPKRDPSIAPKFTAKQGQYLAFIHYYTKVHRQGLRRETWSSTFRFPRPRFTR